MKHQIKLAVGFIVYGQSDYKYLPEFLPSLTAAIRQAGVDDLIIAFDNFPKDQANSDWIKHHFPDIQIMSAGHNLGFGAAYNKMFAEAFNWGADYFLVTNTDIFWATKAIAELLAAVELDDRLGSVSPKVYHWDYALDKPTKIIDTCGIVKLPGLRFVDAYQRKFDNGIDSADIIGPSGCAGLYRMDALSQVKVGREIFDEDFFMYKEDCDLAMRLYLSGWKTEFIPLANAWHDRTAKGRGLSFWNTWLAYKKQNNSVKKWSFRGQLILYWKYWRKESLKSQIVLFFHLFLRLSFAFIFSKTLWSEFKEFWRVRARIKSA